MDTIPNYHGLRFCPTCNNILKPTSEFEIDKTETIIYLTFQCRNVKNQ